MIDESHEKSVSTHKTQFFEKSKKMKSIILFFCALLFTKVRSTKNVGNVNAVYELIDRVLGEHVTVFDLEIDSSLCVDVLSTGCTDCSLSTVDRDVHIRDHARPRDFPRLAQDPMPWRQTRSVP